MHHKYISKDLLSKFFKNTVILGKGKNPDKLGNDNNLGGGDIIFHMFNSSKIFSCGSIPFTRCINDKQVTIMINNVIRNFIHININIYILHIWIPK